MTKLETAAKHCSNWCPARKACLFDKACEPAKCSYWPVVEATAARASKPKNGGKV